MTLCRSMRRWGWSCRLPSCSRRAGTSSPMGDSAKAARAPPESLVRGWPSRGVCSWPWRGVGAGVGGGDALEQPQAFFGVAAGLGVVGDQGLPAAPGDEQLFVVELQRPDLRVVEQAGAGALVLDVLPGPERAEALAAQGQVADELGQARVAGVGADDRTQVRDGPGGHGVPVRAQLAHLRLGEGVEDGVAAGGDEVAERGGESVGGEDVRVLAVDVRGGERPAADEGADAVADLLLPAGALAAGDGRLGELKQVG